jgi:tetratricopeptide (TPR) repeat protein
MKLNRIIILFAITISSANSLFAQDQLFYVSIQGNWDKQKQKSRAQFGGDNKLINTYFNNFTMDLLRSGSDVKGTGEISFLIRTDGTVDSLVINKKIGQQYDSTVYKILRSMSGKWRTGQMEGTKKDESLTIWYNIYKGPKSRKTMEECVIEGKKSTEKGDFKKALKYAENALDYDPLNAEATIIKANALAKLNERAQACELIRSTLKYDNEKLTGLLTEFCK